jgi:hypothetical protein
MRIGDKQREILEVIAARCYVDERYGQIKCPITDNLFGWTVFDTYSERDRFFKNLDKRGLIELSKDKHFALITDAGRSALSK